MCEVTLKIDESQVRKINPELKDIDAITRWAQHMMDVRIADLLEFRSRKNQKPYTIEEINARIDRAEQELANGEGMDFDEAMDLIEKELEEELEMAEAV